MAAEKHQLALCDCGVDDDDDDDGLLVADRVGCRPRALSSVI